jgi:oligosaccharide reducing-end xylanase
MKSAICGALAYAILATVGCGGSSSDSGASNQGMGGSSSTGGASTGGVSTAQSTDSSVSLTGGTSNVTSSSNTASTGGVTSSNSGTSAGGTNAASGATSTGGTRAIGGATSPGGTAATSAGGSKTGGATSQGGTKATSGATSQGGTKATGGVTSQGGTKATGGAGGAGGTAGSTGTVSSGGALGTGGSAAGGSTGARAACTAPATYRNLFVEILGKTEAEVEAKLKGAVQQLFHGTGDQPIYFEMGSDQAYLEDINNNDVRSEGVSYGMFIAVQMDMKTEFDKLWKFAATRMRQSSGLFAWQLSTSGSVMSTNDAPDGDEYFAMALMLASRRWGDSTGTDYASEAKKVMSAMVNKGGFNKNPAVVTFGPPINTFTDPSYVLPLFYSEWACFDTENAAFWQSATTYARTFFQKTCDKNTGLAADHASFDGTPQGDFGYDAWRVPMNIMMDHNLNNADSWQTTYAKTMAAFWTKEGLSSYGDKYTLSGSKQESTHRTGMVAVNAMLAFALPVADGKPFLQAVWDVAIPSGTQDRYYSGCLYMLSMLHMSGKFSLFCK